MKLLYNLGILIYSAVAWLISPFSEKASLWVAGRRNWEGKISDKIRPGDRAVWIHCASLGEFEQGRPVIEEIRQRWPEIKILLTFFSPSGYEIRKNYQFADCIIYLPADTPGNAKKFLSLVNPSLVIFVKYEFWNNYISLLHNRKIPIYLISAIFRADQHFFRWYGNFFRAMLDKIEMIFLQDRESAGLLEGIGLKNFVLAGDTRFDRVMQIASAAKSIPQLEKFRNGEKLFLAGSSWKPDEEIIARYINSDPGRMKWVFAPHEIDNQNIERLEKLFETTVVRFSRFSEESAGARVLIIDNIGMLSSAYSYAHIAEVGGGFGKGIHNILEPACWGIPVLFGPNHLKFREAVQLKQAGGAKSFGSYEEFEGIMDEWLTSGSSYSSAAEIAGNYVKENTGATGIILKEIALKI